jgi:putative phage-type endonuclease
VIARLVCERLTGQPTESFISQAMQNGTDREPIARECYEFLTGVTVEQVAIVKHPTIAHSHASPDGLVGDDGLIEIKCPIPATHLFDHLLPKNCPKKYWQQIQWQLACTGRKWCDFISYSPEMPTHLQIYIQRIERDDAAIAAMEATVITLLAEVEATITQLGAIQ